MYWFSQNWNFVRTLRICRKRHGADREWKNPSGVESPNMATL